TSGLEVILDDLTALHHEPHTLHLGDVAQGISCDRDQIRELALLDRSQRVLLADNRRIDRGGHPEGIDRRSPPTDKDGKHFCLNTVRALARRVENPALPVGDRSGAAAKAEPNTGGQHLLPRRLLNPPST